MTMTKGTPAKPPSPGADGAVKIDDKVRVEVTGEFDKDLIGSKVELDVKRLSVLR